MPPKSVISSSFREKPMSSTASTILPPRPPAGAASPASTPPPTHPTGNETQSPGSTMD